MSPGSVIQVIDESKQVALDMPAFILLEASRLWWENPHIPLWILENKKTENMLLSCQPDLPSSLSLAFVSLFLSPI